MPRIEYIFFCFFGAKDQLARFQTIRNSTQKFFLLLFLCFLCLVFFKLKISPSPLPENLSVIHVHAFHLFQKMASEVFPPFLESAVFVAKGQGLLIQSQISTPKFWAAVSSSIHREHLWGKVNIFMQYYHQECYQKTHFIGFSPYIEHHIKKVSICKVMFQKQPTWSRLASLFTTVVS